MKKVNLHNTMDARIWAKEWLKCIKKYPSIPTDEGCMIGWFANAIMAGYDGASRPFKKEDNNVSIQKKYVSKIDSILEKAVKDLHAELNEQVSEPPKCSVPDCENKAIVNVMISINNKPKKLLPVCRIHADSAKEDFSNCPVCGYDKFACVCKKDKSISSHVTWTSKIQKKVIEFIAGEFDINIEQINYNNTLADIGLDSLDEVELAIAVEDIFGIEISPEYEDKLHSLPIVELTKYIVQLLKIEIKQNVNYVEGYINGVVDKEQRNSPIYLSNDQEGADSDAHKDYIEGYLYGYKI